MSIRRSVWALLLSAFFLHGIASALDCSGLPVTFPVGEFPTGDFFSNFDNDCYTIRLGTGVGNSKYGDLNAVYYQLYYKVNPQYQLILIGTFPNTRYFSVSLNDSHSALSESLLDQNIAPLTSQYVNPYQPGVPYVDGQQYAVPITFGGTPGTLEPGCMMTAYNVVPNGMDATRRHPGMDWNNDSGFLQQYPDIPAHVVDTPQHTNPNTAGVLMIRAYVDDTPSSYATNPHVIVRDTASGCAYPAAYALDTLQIVAQSASVGSAWMDGQQHQAHKKYETSYLPKLCDAPIASPDLIRWTRQPEYVPATNPNASYLTAQLPANLPATLAAAGEVLRVRVRIPTTPPTPCTDGCSRTGDEQMRYMSLSLVEPSGETLASLADTYFAKDSSGYATLIVGTGASIPSWITAANGYTFLDLTALENYQQLALLTVRHVIPGPGFVCAGQFLPYRTSVDGPNGSFVGDYEPMVDYPAAATLPKVAAPLVVQAACDTFPTGVSGVRPNCGVFPEAPIAIAGVVTQCQTPGCSQFIAQAKPPIVITGTGFGVFPGGAPFDSGTSPYLQIFDSTQNWSAGYTKDACTVSISSWADNLIQFVANVADSGKCPLGAGDTVHVEVWNPQTMTSAKAQVTVTTN
jgi:hypothetical protein